MALIHEHLSGMGVVLHDDDYSSMILMSLPKLYTTHLETLADSTTSSETPSPPTISSLKQLIYTKSVSCVPDEMPSQGTRTPHSKLQTIRTREKWGRNLGKK